MLNKYNMLTDNQGTKLHISSTCPNNIKYAISHAQRAHHNLVATATHPSWRASSITAATICRAAPVNCGLAQYRAEQRASG